MKKLLSIVIALTILLSIALPVSAGAVTKVEGVKQTGASNSTFEVSWNEYYGATKYKLEWCNTPNGSYTVDSQYITSYKDTVYNRYAATTYYVKVTPYVNGGWLNAAASNPIAVNTAPNNVTNLKQTKCTKNTATLSWTGSLGATSYKIYKWTNSIETYVGSSKTTSYTLKGLSNTKDHSFSYIHVRPVRNTTGYDATGGYESLYNYYIKLTPAKPKAPSISYFSSYSGNVDFTYYSLKYQNGYQYKVYKANSKKTVLTLNDSRYATGLKKGQFYKVRARVYTNLNGNKVYGPWSNYTYFSTGVKNLRCTSKGTNSIRVAYSKVKGGKVKYDIYVSSSYNKGLKKFKKNVKSTSVNVTKIGKKRLSRNTYYYVYVKPKIKAGKKFKVSPIYSYLGTYTKY